MASSNGQRVGSVARLWRYPVKSMGAEELTASHVGPKGMLGDRAYALLSNLDGTVGSAKHLRRWSMLLACDASYASPPRQGEALPPVRMTFPDGSAVMTTDQDADARLSTLLGHPVRLAAEPPKRAVMERVPLREDGGIAPADGPLARSAVAFGAPGTFFDYGPVHLVTSAALDALGAANGTAGVAPERFRANVLLASDDGAGFADNDWVGRRLALGAEVVLRVEFPTPRCVVPALAQAGVGRDDGLLRTLARLNRLAVGGGRPAPCLGVYADVERPGTVGVGDEARLLPA